MTAKIFLSQAQAFLSAVLTHFMTVDLLHHLSDFPDVRQYACWSTSSIISQIAYRINEPPEGSNIAAARNHLTLHGQTSVLQPPHH